MDVLLFLITNFVHLSICFLSLYVFSVCVHRFTHTAKQVGEGMGVLRAFPPPITVQRSVQHKREVRKGTVSCRVPASLRNNVQSYTTLTGERMKWSSSSITTFGEKQENRDLIIKKEGEGRYR